MRRQLRIALSLSALWGAAPALAQDAPPAAGGTGADQVVGLFGATCLHFPGDVAGLRAFMQQQGGRPMDGGPFLAGRPGVVYDTSSGSVRLALVSLDNGGCEAVVDQADPDAVVQTLQQAAQENGMPLTALGSEADRRRAGVQHQAFAVTLAGQTMHVLVATADATPQAVLILVPR